MRAPIRLIIKIFNIYDGCCRCYTRTPRRGGRSGEGQRVIDIAVIERTRFALLASRLSRRPQKQRTNPPETSARERAYDDPAV